jgi:hypothetical protein
MSRRRSHPPRGRKARKTETEAPPQDVAVVTAQADSVSELVGESVAPPAAVDELAALDAGWDEVG